MHYALIFWLAISYGTTKLIQNEPSANDSLAKCEITRGYFIPSSWKLKGAPMDGIELVIPMELM